MDNKKDTDYVRKVSTVESGSELIDHLYDQIEILEDKIVRYEAFIYSTSKNLGNCYLTRGTATILVEKFKIKDRYE